MRWLFVPACLGLTALSAPVGNDFGIPFEQLNHARVATSASASEPLPSIAADGREEQATEEALSNDRPAVPTEQETASSQIDNALIGVAPLPKPKPEIKPVIYRSKEEVCDTLTKAAHNNGLPVPFFIHLLFQESRFSPGVVSNAGAQGIAQFMPDTASEWGVDNPFDPLQAIPASARLLRNLFERFGNLGLAAAAYNAGPRRIQDWLAKKGSLPQETQGYVKTITGRRPEGWTGNESGTPALKLPRHAPCQDEAGLLAWNGPDEIPTPIVAPHRRSKEPVVVAAAAPSKKGDISAGKNAKSEANTETKGEAKAEAKAGVKITHSGGHATATIKVADASGGLPHVASLRDNDRHGARKKDEPKKIVAEEKSKPAAEKKAAKSKTAKEALQLAARKHPRKLRVSER